MLVQPSRHIGIPSASFLADGPDPDMYMTPCSGVTPPPLRDASISSLSTGNVPAAMCHAPQRFSTKVFFVPIMNERAHSSSSSISPARSRPESFAQPVGIRAQRTPSVYSPDSLPSGHFTPTRSTFASFDAISPDLLSRLPTLTMPLPEEEEEECATIMRPRHQRTAGNLLFRRIPSPLSPFAACMNPSPKPSRKRRRDN